jgi:hypothetical protein
MEGGIIMFNTTRSKNITKVILISVVCLIFLLCACKREGKVASEANSNASSIPVSNNLSSQNSTEILNNDIEKVLILKSTGNTYNYTDNTLTFTYKNGKYTSEFPTDWTKKIFLQDFQHNYYVSANKTAVVCAENNSLVIVYSNDMGKTWNQSKPILATDIQFRAALFPGRLKSIDSVGCFYINFASDTCGYLFIGSETAMSHQPDKVLFKTIDGGKTWNFVDPGLKVDSIGSWEYDIHNPPPYIITFSFNEIINKISFINNSIGFLCGSSGAGGYVAWIGRTADGGMTYTTYQLQLPPTNQYGSATMFAPYLISGKLYLPIRIDGDYVPSKIIYFTSSDEGKSWSYDQLMDTLASVFIEITK